MLSWNDAFAKTNSKSIEFDSGKNPVAKDDRWFVLIAVSVFVVLIT